MCKLVCLLVRWCIMCELVVSYVFCEWIDVLCVGWYVICVLS